ncbi:hypothetical protein Z965_05155 [Clostridium novyi A str. BKT29909]|uniref:hypothetical protein n=1 Tax=Clostridium novyi TaxID=1542 RepID=UPI0004D59536|nr:hypothetical protein [Clostridium novyi]KEH87954.1 hypothetical protein Z965_05155 [Clostridium novyi A str. BKT29909]
MRICGKYIYSRLINNLPWAISAIMKANGIVNSIEEDKKDDIMIPSYIYFGVNNKEAVILCMFGVTRYAAFILAKEWRSLYGEVRLQDINKVEDWLGHLSLQDWKEIFYRYNGKKVETNYYIWRKQK